MASDHAALRAMAVRRVLDGDAAEDVADAFAVSTRPVRRWPSAWRGRGAAGLRDRPRPGRPPKLTAPQAAGLLSWFERDPTEFGFPTSWWTAPRVADLARRRLGASMNHRYLDDRLRRRGITPQVPETRAAERDEAGIARWVAVEWPAIKRQAHATHATLCFTGRGGIPPVPR
jgi:transposase